MWVSKACRVCGCRRLVVWVCRRLVGCVCQRFVGCMWVSKAYSVGVGVEGL